MRYIKRFALIVTFVLILPIVAVAFPGNAPDGNNTLIQIFPDEENSALAEDVACMLGSGYDTAYIPSNTLDFDRINTISLSNSNVRYMYGLQYLQKLNYLYLSGNLLTDAEMDILPELTKLTNLDLAGNKISSASFHYLSGLMTYK